MNPDIQLAFTDAATDTFDALTRSPHLDDPAVVKPLDAAYLFLQEVTGVSAQILFNNISRAAFVQVEASDHVMLVSGSAARELSCDTCGRLLLAHGAYDEMRTVIDDLEAVSTLLEVSAAHEARRG